MEPTPGSTCPCCMLQPPISPRQHSKPRRPTPALLTGGSSLAQHLAASTPVSPHLFCCGARLRCAETTPAQAHHLPNLAARIHDAGLPSGSLVHVGWAVRQLREPDWKALPHDGWRFETLNFWIRFNSTIFGFTLLALRIPSSLFCFRFFSGVFPLIGGGGGCICPIVARLTWDFACVFVCVDSGILFVSLEKVFILALEGTRFPSLLRLPETLELSMVTSSRRSRKRSSNALAATSSHQQLTDTVTASVRTPKHLLRNPYQHRPHPKLLPGPRRPLPQPPTSLPGWQPSRRPERRSACTN